MRIGRYAVQEAEIGPDLDFPGLGRPRILLIGAQPVGVAVGVATRRQQAVPRCASGGLLAAGVGSRTSLARQSNSHRRLHRCSRRALSKRTASSNVPAEKTSASEPNSDACLRRNTPQTTRRGISTITNARGHAPRRSRSHSIRRRGLTDRITSLTNSKRTPPSTSADPAPAATRHSAAPVGKGTVPLYTDVTSTRVSDGLGS